LKPLCILNTSIPLQHFLQWEKDTPHRVFLRQPICGEWKTFSFAEAGDAARRMASAIKTLLPTPHSKVAILSKNCAHWIIADLAIMMAGHISVPIYPTLSADGIRPLLEHSGSQLIFLGKLDNYQSQKSALPESLQRISFPFYGVKEGMLWDDLIQKFDPVKNIAVLSEEAVATIMYSSGTTGTPKGVMLSHGAFGHVGINVSKHLKVTRDDRFFSYLPLSHIAERGLMEMVALAAGSTISFAESLDVFTQNLQHERPTIFGGVPRIFAKFKDGILSKLPQSKLSMLLKIPVIRGIIRKKIRRGIGFDDVRVVVCGAAPSPVSMLEWFDSIGIEIEEVYGMTENTAFSHANYRKVKFGSVGEPWPGVDVKLSTTNEIMIRHRAVMKGYYKDDVTTASVLTPDGFLKTGDEGSIDPEGFLTITGRVKDQFKTDKGKFIAPGPIELKLLETSDIGQVCVVGTGIPQPIALITLSIEGKTKSSDAIRKGLNQSLNRVNNGLEHYERLEKAIIMKEDWTQENGLLTPSLKLKRNELEKIYLAKYSFWYARDEVVIWE
jgi:long-chain acyl-CoA synthetase